MKTIIDCFGVVISSQKDWSNVYILHILKKKMFDRNLIFFLMKKGIQKVYVTVLPFILYPVWVHVESPNYKMICHQNQVNLHFILSNSGQKSLIMFISLFLTTFQLIFKNREIKKINKLSIRWDSRPKSLSFEATEHLRNRMRKENWRTRL